jgi:antitoxin PrlF
MPIYATITSKNQMTVPAELRDDLGLKPGDKLKIVKIDEGGYRIEKAESLASLSGIVKTDVSLSDEELAQAIRTARMAIGGAIDRN